MAAVKLCTSSLLRNPLAVRLAVARTLSTSHAAANVAKEDIHPVYFKHKENQKAWRVDTGEMVGIKRASRRPIEDLTCPVPSFVSELRQGRVEQEDPVLHDRAPDRRRRGPVHPLVLRQGVPTEELKPSIDRERERAYSPRA